MLKKTVLFLICLGIALFLVKSFYDRPNPIQPEAGTSKKVEKTVEARKRENVINFVKGNQELEAAWVIVQDVGKMQLHSNLVDKKTARETAKESNCTNLVNGGFYSKEGKTIGLFIDEGKTVSKYKKNKTFDGIFYITSDNLPQIGTTLPGSIRLAVQSGPILINENRGQNYSINNDRQERRIVVAIDKSKIIFLAIYEKSSVFKGPYLADLPKVLKIVEDKSGMKFESALNLDGGTASAFIINGTTLGELSLIGSYFCF